MIRTWSKSPGVAPVCLVICGLAFGAGLRRSEPLARASSLECDDSYHAKLVEVRRVEGTGAVESQVWGDSLLLLSVYRELEVKGADDVFNSPIVPEGAQ